MCIRDRPKGVVYTDGLWLANMQSYEGAQVGFSYMPLAFITDRHTVYTALWNGGCVGIATARQGGDTAQIFRDLLAVRPTVLKGVPAFWEQAQSRPISRLISADLARPPCILSLIHI